MKNKFVADLNTEQPLTSIFLVCAKEVRNTRDGKPYLRMELGDRTGTIEARMWDRFEAAASQIARDDIIHVKGRVEIYKNKPQLALESFRRASPEEVNLADYLPHTEADVEKLYAEMVQTAEGLRDAWLRKLVVKIVTDPAIAPRLKRAPAAKMMHHAYLGGLLEHVVSLCGLARAVAGHYPELNLDLILTGVLLHDVGKLDELSYERAISYTAEGQLLGHIVMEVESVGRAMDSIEGFPPPLKTVVQHLLISHHGEYAFGSPKLPMIREALVLHFLDDLDSKMAAMRAALALNSGDPQWSEWSGALQRRFLRLEEYLQGKASGEAGKSGEAGAAKAAPGTAK
ncbi:MAG: HD domain-containing protein [Acidobacteriia bacterium]|nr:HD domain-containing protein [Terriglobia bacterium]